MSEFTLTEVLVTLGLVSMLASAGLGIGYDAIPRASTRQDRDLLVDVLMLSRARAMNGTCSSPCSAGPRQGVRIETGRFVLFEGITYDQRKRDTDESFPRSGSDISGAPEIVFDASGQTAAAATISIGNAGREYAVSVDTTGRITSHAIAP